MYLNIHGIKSAKNTLFDKKRVFLRADLNIPLKNGEIQQDYRLLSLLPTIDLIQKKGGKIILATHLGRPENPTPNKNNYFADPTLSTKLLIPWFELHGCALDYEYDLERAKDKSKENQERILILENLRFFKDEKDATQEFAQKLTQIADIYVNDAFALIHRKDTSVTLVPQLFDRNNRTIGLLMEKELESLEKLRLNQSSQFSLVLGGRKIEDKIPMLAHFITPSKQHQSAQKILIGGTLSRVFLKAQGYSCGQENPTKQALTQAKDIIKLAQKHNVRLYLPQDFLYTQNSTSNIHTCSAQAIPEQALCCDIGPQTIDSYAQILQTSDVIFCNGPMGMYEDPRFDLGTQKILAAIASTSAYTVIGGGDTIGAVYAFGQEQKFSFLSTGGGATLAFLGCKDPFNDLPALKALLHN